MIGFRFSEFKEDTTQSPFDRLLKLFLELMTYTSGDVEETFDWMKQLDAAHNITDDDYTLDDFRKDLERKSLLLSLIHISEPTRRTPISYAVFCLKKRMAGVATHDTGE